MYFCENCIGINNILLLIGIHIQNNIKKSNRLLYNYKKKFL